MDPTNRPLLRRIDGKLSCASHSPLPVDTGHAEIPPSEPTQPDNPFA